VGVSKEGKFASPKRSKRVASGGASLGSEREVVEHVQKAPCSIEFSRDAKGQARWGLKLYGELDSMDQVVDEVLRLDTRLRKEAK